MPTPAYWAPNKGRSGPGSPRCRAARWLSPVRAAPGRVELREPTFVTEELVFDRCVGRILGGHVGLDPGQCSGWCPGCLSISVRTGPARPARSGRRPTRSGVRNPPLCVEKSPVPRGMACRRPGSNLVIVRVPLPARAVRVMAAPVPVLPLDAQGPPEIDGRHAPG